MEKNAVTPKKMAQSFMIGFAVVISDHDRSGEDGWFVLTILVIYLYCPKPGFKVY
jgi:hypothetical protein